MKILNAILAADNLSPNHFTLDEKLMWCNEVTQSIRREVKKEYETIETVVTAADEIYPPEDIPFSDIEMVYIDGRPINKTDFRSIPFLNRGELINGYGINFSTPKRMRIVYLSMPKEIRNIEICGEFTTDSGCIHGSELPFIEGDCIQITAVSDLNNEPAWDDAAETYVMSNDGEKIFLSDDVLTPETSAKLAIKRIIDDETEADAPYDRMYIEYILAKGALYQHDYDGYTAHMTQFNCLFDEFKRDYKTRNPLTDMAGFHNFW